jgi:hypothetical protein
LLGKKKVSKKIVMGFVPFEFFRFLGCPANLAIPEIGYV